MAAPRNVARVTIMKKTIEKANAVNMKFARPKSGNMRPGELRKMIKNRRKNSAPRNPPIRDLPASDAVSPIGIATKIGMKKRYVASSGNLFMIMLE